MLDIRFPIVRLKARAWATRSNRRVVAHSKDDKMKLLRQVLPLCAVAAIVSQVVGNPRSPLRLHSRLPAGPPEV